MSKHNNIHCSACYSWPSHTGAHTHSHIHTHTHKIIGMYVHAVYVQTRTHF